MGVSSETISLKKPINMPLVRVGKLNVVEAVLVDRIPPRLNNEEPEWKD